MDQYTNYLDALSQSTYPQQPNTTSAFLSPESHPPSLSASPVSSEGSETWVDEAIRYGFFSYDHSPAPPYNPYNSLAFSYPTHPNTVTSLADMLAESAPFATVAPSATSALPFGDTSAYNLSNEIAELSISSPVSSPVYNAARLSSSPSLAPVLQSQPSPVCDPKVLDSPVIMEQSIIQPGSPSHAGSSRGGEISYLESTIDSDYSPSGESEIDDENDPSYGTYFNRKKTRSVRMAHAAHPYSKPAPKTKSSKRRSTRIEIPIPVPGLTNNSRGRCVPKRSEYEDESRPFWCNVKYCDKLFSRGEHLKRHITSIHTKDKPFECDCQKKFSRRDNLFQHMRTKGCVVWYDNGVKQTRDGGVSTSEVEQKSALEDAKDRRQLERMIADAEIAKKKQEEYFRRMRGVA